MAAVAITTTTTTTTTSTSTSKASMWNSDMENLVYNYPRKRTLVFGSDKKRSLFRPSDKSQTLGIMAFETGKNISRLISIHKSLSDDQVFKLRRETVKSEGVSFLISRDEDYLLRLACMEKMEELDRIGMVVSRLGKNCSDPDLFNFGRIYADMKLGVLDLSNFSASKKKEKTMEKLEKYVLSTAELYSGLEALSEMEMSERKLKNWKYSGPVARGGKDLSAKPNFDLLESKLLWHRQEIRRLRQVSLWGQTFNKIIRLMARAICVVYARLSIVFSPYMIKPARHTRIASHPDMQAYLINRPDQNVASLYSKSGPISRRRRDTVVASGTSALMKQAGQSTAGGSGLAFRYAKVVLITEKYMKAWSTINETDRDDLYHLLPRSLRCLVKSKLRKLRTSNAVDHRVDDSLAEGWLEGLNRILGWLSPMAHDTLKWQLERNVEKQDFDPKPKVLLLQTLFFADREKSEAAIAEVLVALSCICKFKLQNLS